MPMYLYVDVRWIKSDETALLPTRFNTILQIVHSIPFILPVPYYHWYSRGEAFPIHVLNI